MVEFQLVIGDPKSRRSYKLEVKGKGAENLLGKKIGDEFEGNLIGLPGYKLKITGGTDKDGFPMHPALPGPGRHRAILDKSPCFHPKRKGERRRKTVRGNVISPDIKQINCKIVSYGEKSLEQLIHRSKASS